MILKYIIKENDNYTNLKDLLKNFFEISDRLLIKLKHEKKIFINDNIASVNSFLNCGDVVSIYIDFIEEALNIVPIYMPLDIVFEDDALLVLNKPAGVPVHPSIDHYTDSLSNGVKFYFDQIKLKRKIRPINRLDKNTSGLVLFAKNEYIQECLVKQMKLNIFTKEYIALCEGVFKNKIGTINAPISRKNDSIIERCVSENGDISITDYEVIKETNNYSIVKCSLKTGRTHQIRVHLSYIGHPLLGDTLYGNTSTLINRQALHAYKVSFIHPITKERKKFCANFPDDINKLISIE